MNMPQTIFSTKRSSKNQTLGITFHDQPQEYVLTARKQLQLNEKTFQPNQTCEYGVTGAS